MKQTGINSVIPWARLNNLNFLVCTFLNSTLESISPAISCHYSAPPITSKLEKKRSISRKKSVFRYPGSISNSALNRIISLISTSSSQYLIRNVFEEKLNSSSWILLAYKLWWSYWDPLD